MIKKYKNYSKGIKTGRWSEASFASVLSPRTVARATFASDERLWILRVRLGTGCVGLIVPEQGRSTTP